MALSPKERSAINRQNAQKSTGPRSPAGKKRSSRNAITHGATALDSFIDDDERQEFDDLFVRWSIYCDPGDPATDEHIKLVVHALMVLRRCRRWDASLSRRATQEALAAFDEAEQAMLDEHLKGLVGAPTIHGPALETFGAGLRWKLQQWRELRHTLTAETDWPWQLYHTAAELMGCESADECLREEPRVWLFVWHFIHMAATPDAEMLATLTDPENCPDEYRNLPKPTEAEATRALLGMIDGEIDRLAPLADERTGIEQGTRDDAYDAALILNDTPKHILKERYEKRAQATFERSSALLKQWRAARTGVAAVATVPTAPTLAPPPPPPPPPPAEEPRVRNEPNSDASADSETTCRMYRLPSGGYIDDPAIAALLNRAEADRIARENGPPGPRG